MTLDPIPPEFRAAIAAIAESAMSYGVTLALSGRDHLEVLLRANPAVSLGDALAPEVQSLLDIRPSLVESAYVAAQPPTRKARP